MEALTPRDCATLAGKDPRELLYAACRELQQAGETLRKEGAVFRPEGSGGPVDLDEKRVSEGLSPAGQMPERRLDFVQNFWKDFRQFRRYIVQEPGAVPVSEDEIQRKNVLLLKKTLPKFRRSIVQAAARETLPDRM